jgi:NTE family protein
MKEEAMGNAGVPTPWVDEADAVFKGGGVKGLALAGALAGCAEHPTKPIRQWKNVAGASAGAIIASYLAIGKDAKDMLAAIADIPYPKLQDFPYGQKLLGIAELIAGAHGLAKGDAFLEWFDKELGGATFAGLADGQGDFRLRMIAVDTTMHRLLVLPKDLADYREPGSTTNIDPATFSIAHAARMSMSIPYFFEPVRLVHVDPDSGTTTDCEIVDGGTLSNFPVWLFDVDPRITGRPPVRPTIGFNLTGGHGVGGGIHSVVAHLPWAVRFGVSIFDTAEEAWDARFASHSTRTRTISVDADGVGTTDFELTEQKRELLIQNGREAATKFLDAFDLDAYKNTFHASVEPSDVVAPR